MPAIDHGVSAPSPVPPVGSVTTRDRDDEHTGAAAAEHSKDPGWKRCGPNDSVDGAEAMANPDDVVVQPYDPTSDEGKAQIAIDHGDGDREADPIGSKRGG